jgi:putative acetyltransferase
MMVMSAIPIWTISATVTWTTETSRFSVLQREIHDEFLPAQLWSEEVKVDDQAQLRLSTPSDMTEIEHLYSEAFPDEDLFPLVSELVNRDYPVHSFVAVRQNGIVGHVAFTICRVVPGDAEVALLAPLCAAPAFQAQGIGSALVCRGFECMTGLGIGQVMVLGDPNYYSRFGFAPDDRIEPPYQLPDAWKDAWQSVQLQPEIPGLSGKLITPEPWNVKALWVP